MPTPAILGLPVTCQVLYPRMNRVMKRIRHRAQICMDVLF